MEKKACPADMIYHPTEDESYNIQILRGLSIIAVVFIHNTPPGLSQVFCRPFLNFSVAMFLFLSGMLSNAQKWNPQKRIIKILVPYIFWTAVFVLVNTIKAPLNFPRQFAEHLLLGDAAAMMYYVFVYIELTLLIPIIDRISRSRFQYIVFVIPFLEIIIFRLFPIVFGNKYGFFLSNIIRLSCIGWFAFFYYGYLLGNRHIKLSFSLKTIFALLLLCLALQFLEGFWYYSLGEANCGTQQKITSVMTNLVFCNIGYRFIISNKRHVLKPIKILGDYSFGIFFSHLLFMKILARLPGYNSHVVFPLNGIFSLLASMLFVYLCKITLKKYSKYLAC